MTRNPSRQRGFTLVELLIVVAIIGIIAAIAIPNLLNAVDNGRQKRTMADIRSVGSAIENYAIDTGFYPEATSWNTLKGIVQPNYIRQTPMMDAWSNAFVVSSANTGYTVCSPGKDGVGSCLGDTGGGVQGFNQSITWANGAFAQWPQGVQSN